MVRVIPVTRSLRERCAVTGQQGFSSQLHGCTVPVGLIVRVRVISDNLFVLPFINIHSRNFTQIKIIQIAF